LFSFESNQAIKLFIHTVKGLFMALEKGIAQLVQGFIAAGRPSSRRQSIEVRRAGYIASTGLAGETETRVQETLVLEGLTIRVFSPLNAPELLPAAIYYHGGCFISGGFDTHDNQLRQLACRQLPGGCDSIQAGAGAYFPRRT
jgi:acetyl esterase/lipase